MEHIISTVNNIIFGVLKDKISFEDITPEKSLTEDLNAESVELMEIFMTLMADFDIEIEREELNNLKNINEICLYVNAALERKNVG